MENKRYGTWANYETWNVNIWLNYPQENYLKLAEYCRNQERPNYAGYLRYAGLGDAKTGDGVSYADPALCIDELDAMITELAQGLALE